MRGFRMIGFVLLFAMMSQGAWSQDPLTIIQQGITKVIQAVDLQIQRLQTETIWLQEAQKTVENAMSQLDLDEIKGWVQAQKDLYGEYFQELWEVKNVISSYEKVSAIIRRQEQIMTTYKQAYALFRLDPHFSATELSHMESVYAGMLSESSRNLDQLLLVIKSFSVQMSDEARMALINSTGAAMDKNYEDLVRFNSQNALLSMQRASDENELAFLRQIYGL